MMHLDLLNKDTVIEGADLLKYRPGNCVWVVHSVSSKERRSMLVLDCVPQ